MYITIIKRNSKALLKFQKYRSVKLQKNKIEMTKTMLRVSGNKATILA